MYVNAFREEFVSQRVNIDHFEVGSFRASSQSTIPPEIRFPPPKKGAHLKVLER